MTEHGLASDEWPAIYPQVLAADILVIAGRSGLGDNSSVTKRVIERLYGYSHLLNDGDVSGWAELPTSAGWRPAAGPP
jgi:multimeric flavodoxin WrbA